MAVKSDCALVRITLGLTQRELADILQVALSTIQSWEQGKREPSGAARMLISIALKNPEVFRDEMQGSSAHAIASPSPAPAIKALPQSYGYLCGKLPSPESGP